jgi:hypothetical protein
MNQFSNPEAKAMRDRLNEYLRPSEQDLANILPIEFAFKQLLDAILSTYPLDEHTLIAIERLEESLEWAKKSVKRTKQLEVTSLDIFEIPTSLGNLAFYFELVTQTLLDRCHTNREQKAALSRLHEAHEVMQRTIMLQQ